MKPPAVIYHDDPCTKLKPCRIICPISEGPSHFAFTFELLRDGVIYPGFSSVVALRGGTGGGGGGGGGGDGDGRLLLSCQFLKEPGSTHLSFSLPLLLQPMKNTTLNKKISSVQGVSIRPVPEHLPWEDCHNMLLCSLLPHTHTL